MWSGSLAEDNCLLYSVGEVIDNVKVFVLTFNFMKYFLGLGLSFTFKSDDYRLSYESLLDGFFNNLSSNLHILHTSEEI